MMSQHDPTNHNQLELDRAALARALDGRAALARATRARAAVGIDDRVLDIVVDRLLADLDALPDAPIRPEPEEPALVLTTAGRGFALAPPSRGPLASIGGRNSFRI